MWWHSIQKAGQNLFVMSWSQTWWPLMGASSLLPDILDRRYLCLFVKIFCNIFRIYSFLLWLWRTLNMMPEHTEPFPPFRGGIFQGSGGRDIIAWAEAWGGFPGTPREESCLWEIALVTWVWLGGVCQRRKELCLLSSFQELGLWDGVKGLWAKVRAVQGHHSGLRRAD